MKFFVANKELQSPNVEAACKVVQQKQPMVLHSVEDTNIDAFVIECEKAGITHSNVSVNAALHLIHY